MLDVLIIIPEITKGMKSIGPKAMLKIKNTTTILHHQINQLNQYNKCNIFLSVGFEAEKIKKSLGSYANVDFVYNPYYKSTNQSKSISLFLEQHNTKKLLVISNGILFKNNPFNTRQSSCIYVLDKPKNNFDIGCNYSQSLHYLFYDLPTPWTECVFFDGVAIDQLKSIISTSNIDKLYLFELINLMIDKQKTQFETTIVKKNNFMKVNTVKDLPRARVFI